MRKKSRKRVNPQALGSKQKGGVRASKPIQTELACSSVVRHLLKMCKALGQSSEWKMECVEERGELA